MAEPPRWALARGTVRHVGEAVAAVIAATRAQAEHAADLLAIDYEPLPVIVDGRAAMEKAAPQLHEVAPGNVCFHFARGDEAAVRKAFDGAAHVVRLDLANNRLIGAAIEPRAVLADGGAGKLTLYSSPGAASHPPHGDRAAWVAADRNPPDRARRWWRLRLQGQALSRGDHHRLGGAAAAAAGEMGRHSKRVLRLDYQGRGHQTRAELAVDAEGNFLGLRVDTVANIGAYVSTFGAGIPSAIYSALLAGVYRTPAIGRAIDRCVTNTVPTDAYRGAGRPGGLLRAGAPRR
jgi:carbon-monoxide dehydrogenase large subunit